MAHRKGGASLNAIISNRTQWGNEHLLDGINASFCVCHLTVTLYSQEWFPQWRFCWEREHSTWGMIQSHFKAEVFCYLSMAGSTKKNEWKISIRRCMHRVNRQHIPGRSVFVIVLSEGSTKSISTYIDGFYYRSLRRVIQNRKNRISTAAVRYGTAS